MHYTLILEGGYDTMSVVEELIREDSNGTLSFGNYLLESKTKKADFPFDGASYKIKTFKEITRLERNGSMVYESVPGSVVTNFKENKDEMEFEVEAQEDLNFTVEMEPGIEYELFVNESSKGKLKTNLGGKLSASIELDPGTKTSVKIVKC